jgi:hypothetical protein
MVLRAAPAVAVDQLPLRLQGQGGTAHPDSDLAGLEAGRRAAKARGVSAAQNQSPASHLDVQIDKSFPATWP